MSEQDEQGGSPRDETSGQDTGTATDDNQSVTPADRGNSEDVSSGDGEGRTQEGMAGQGTGQIK